MATVSYVRTTATNLASVDIEDGQIVFVTDTGQYYIDVFSDRIEVGAQQLANSLTTVMNAILAVNSSLSTTIANESIRATGSEQELTRSIQDEQNRAQGVESTLLTNTFTDYVVTNVSVATSGEAVTFIISGVSPSDGSVTDIDIPGPLVSETQPGFATPEMAQQLAQHTADIESLKGQAMRFPAHFGSNTNPTDAQLTQVVTDAGFSLMDGATVVDLDNNIEYIYFSSTSTWSQETVGGVSQATQTSLGVVMGSESSGKIYVEASGVMSLVGYDTLTTGLTNAQNDITSIYSLLNNKATNFTPVTSGALNGVSTLDQLMTRLNAIFAGTNQVKINYTT